MTTYTEQFNLVVKSINYYNDILLNPDKMVWGTMTKEEADDAFNDINNDLHQDWGTKSSEMLLWIREENEEEEEDDSSTIQYRKEIEEGCPKGYYTIWDMYGFKYIDENEFYKHKILVNDKCKVVNNFEVGQYHIFKWGAGGHGFQRHYRMDITKITKCFISFELCDITAGWDYPEDNVKYKKKIQFKKFSLDNCIDIPDSFSCWDNGTEKIKVGDLHKIRL